MKICKYDLEVADSQELEMPEGAEILHVAVHLGNLCLWAIVIPDMALEIRTFKVVGTGHPLPMGLKKYLGSAQIPPLVWHVFEAKET